MNRKLVAVVSICLAIVVGVLVGKLDFKSMILGLFHSKTIEEQTSVEILQHMVIGMAQYEPFRENEVTVIEYWEKRRGISGRFNDDYTYFFAFKSHPSYTIRLDGISVNRITGTDNSNILYVQLEDSMVEFHPNIEDNPLRQHVGSSFGTTKETEIEGQLHGMLEEYLETKYDMRTDAIKRAEEFLESLLNIVDGRSDSVHIEII